MDKLNEKRLDTEQLNQEKLKEVFPERFSKGNLNIDKLLSLCGDYEKYNFEWKGKSNCFQIAQNSSSEHCTLAKKRGIRA